jgi:hypothetical protein
MLQKNPFEVEDFSGGLTDYIYDPNTAKSSILNNFSITLEGKLITRPGSFFDTGSALSEVLLTESSENLLTETSEDLTTETFDINTHAQIPSGATRISSLIRHPRLASKFLVQAASNVYYRDAGIYQTVLGPTSGAALINASVASHVSPSRYGNQILVTHDLDSSTSGLGKVVKLYPDVNGVFVSRNAGLVGLASNPTIGGAAGANNYIYAFTHSYQYQVLDEIFIDESTPIFIEKNNILAPDASVVNITAIPVLGATENVDTANIKINIYRSINNGEALYRVAQITNGTTTYADNSSDTTIQDTGIQLYTNDGSADNDVPARCKFVHVVNNIAYYGYIEEGSEKKPLLVRQSIPDDMDSVPLDFEIYTEDTLKGINSVNNIPILLCEKYTYRVDGAYDQYGRGSPKAIQIDDKAGCISNLSCVKAEGNLFWASSDGFYATDGYRVFKVSNGINTLFQEVLENMDDLEDIQGTYDPKERKIYWTVKDNSALLENNKLFCLDLRFGVKPDSVFSTWNGSTFYASALGACEEGLHRANHRGFVFKHTPANESDPKLESAVLLTNWEDETILWTYRSVAIGGGSVRKWIPKILLTAKNKTNVSIQITAINDDGRSSRDLTPIRWRRNFVWGDEDFIWGNPDCVWNAEGLIEQWRWLPAKGLRNSYIQIEIKNALVNVINSDLLGTADFNDTLNTATLNVVTNSWPSQAVDYYITTEVDNYQAMFKVLTRSDATLVLEDGADNLPNGSYKWLLKGYPKNEVLNLLSYGLQVAPTTDNQLTYELGQSGDNA